MHRSVPLRVCSIAPWFALPLFAQQVRYELRIADVGEHLAEVRATFPTAGKTEIALFLPVWSPGFYRVLNHHERVVDFAAAAGGSGAALAIERPQPNRWHITTGGAAEITATYTLRCAYGAVTENHITDAFAVFCGPATFVGEVGAAARPHAVHVMLPDGWPDVATALPRAPGGGEHDFVARDYDWLVDSPIVLGTIATTPFDVLGSRHEWAQFGDAGDFDSQAIVKVLQPVTAEVCRTFTAVPFERYVFLAGFRRANGGLEHLDSSLLTMRATQSAHDLGTLSFLAHEYTHAFNVKRLRPVELGPFDYEHPPATASLWISEGLTTWVGDLALARAGAIDVDQWLTLVSGHVRALQGSPGRRRQTLADASLSVWKSSTSGVGGDPRTTVSYYVKGPVVGFVLEARLRALTGGARGLDELLRRAYARYAGERGFTPEQFEAIAADVAGSDLRAFFDMALRSTDELDYAEALAWFGLEFAATDVEAPADQRWRLRGRGDASDEQREHLRALLAPSPPLRSADGR